MPNILDSGLRPHEVIDYKTPENLREYGAELLSAVQNTRERFNNLHLDDADRERIYVNVLENLPDALYFVSGPSALTPDLDSKNMPTEGRAKWERAFLQDEVRPNCIWGRNMFHILKLQEAGYTYESLSQLTRRVLSYAGYHVDKKLVRPTQEVWLADKLYHSEVDEIFLRELKERVISIEDSRKEEAKVYLTNPNFGVSGAITHLYASPIGAADDWQPAPLTNPALAVGAPEQVESMKMIENKEFPEDFAMMQKELLRTKWETLVRSELEINSSSSFSMDLKAKRSELEKEVKTKKSKEATAKSELDTATAASSPDISAKAQALQEAEEERKEAEAKLEQFNKQLKELEDKRTLVEEDLDARQKLMETRIHLESRGALSGQEKNEVEALFADEKAIMEDVEARLTEMGIPPREFFAEVAASSYPTQARGVYAFLRDTMEMVRRDCSEQVPATGTSGATTRITNGDFLRHIKLTDVRMQFLMEHRGYIEDVLDTFAPDCVEYAKAKLWFRHNVSSAGCEIKEAYGESLSEKDLEEEAKVHYALSQVERPLLYGSVEAYKHREELPDAASKFLQERREAIHKGIASFGSWEGHAVIGSMLGKLTGLALVKTAKISSYLVGGMLQRGGDYLFQRPGRHLAKSLTDNKLWPLYPLWPFMKLWQGVGYATAGLGANVDEHITHGMLSRENELRVRHALGFAGEYAGKYGARATGYAVDKGVEATVDGAAYKRITNYDQAEDAFTQLKTGLGSAARMELRQHIAPKKVGTIDTQGVLDRIKGDGTLASETIRRMRTTPKPETDEGEAPKPSAVERYKDSWETILRAEQEREKREEEARKKREERRAKRSAA